MFSAGRMFRVLLCVRARTRAPCWERISLPPPGKVIFPSCVWYTSLLFLLYHACSVHQASFLFLSCLLYCCWYFLSNVCFVMAAFYKRRCCWNSLFCYNNSSSMSRVLQLRLSSRNGSYRPDISYFNFWVGHFCKDGLVQKLGRVLIIMAEEGPKGNVTGMLLK